MQCRETYVAVQDRVTPRVPDDCSGSLAPLPGPSRRRGVVIGGAAGPETAELGLDVLVLEALVQRALVDGRGRVTALEG